MNLRTPPTALSAAFGALLLSSSLGCASTGTAPAERAAVPPEQFKAEAHGGVDVHIVRKIDAPADKVWRILAHEFAEIDRWSSLVDKSWSVDATGLPEDLALAADAPIVGRVTATGLGEPMEVFVVFSDERRTYTFQALDLPPMMTSSQNTTRVIDHGDGTSSVTFDIAVVPAGPFKLMNGFFADRLGKGLGNVLDELKYYAETDELPAAKLAKLAETDSD